MSEKVITLTVSAEQWDKFNTKNELAKAAKKAADAEWAILGFPEGGKDWAQLAGLVSGEIARVVVVNGNGIPLAAGQITEKITPPQPQKISWVSPRL